MRYHRAVAEAPNHHVAFKHGDRVGHAVLSRVRPSVRSVMLVSPPGVVAAASALVSACLALAGCKASIDVAVPAPPPRPPKNAMAETPPAPRQTDAAPVESVEPCGETPQPCEQAPTQAPWPPGLIDGLAGRPWIPTSERGCRFSGSLRLDGAKLFLDELTNGHDWSLRAVEVTALEPSRGTRHHVAISFPVEAAGWLDGDVLPFRLRQRVDVAPRLLWLPEGSRVDARRVEPHLEVTRRLADFRPSTEPGVASSAPEVVAVRVPCTTVELAGPYHTLQPPRGDVFVRARRDWIALRRSPGGPSVGAMAIPKLTIFRVTSSQPGWRRLAFGGSLFDIDRGYLAFDAWVAADQVEPFDAFVPTGPRKREPRYADVAVRRVTRPLPIHSRPDPAARLGAVVAVGARLAVGPVRGGFTTVRIGGVRSTHDDLYVPSDALSDHTVEE